MTNKIDPVFECEYMYSENRKCGEPATYTFRWTRFGIIMILCKKHYLVMMESEKQLEESKQQRSRV